MFFAPPLLQRFPLVGRHVIGIPGKVNSVAATVKAGQILQLYQHLPACYLHLPCRPPSPARHGSKYFFNGGTVDVKFETTGSIPVSRHPILGAYPNMVCPLGWKGDGRACIFDGAAEPVCQQVGESKFIVELGVQGPPPFGCEMLCFQ